MNKLRFYLALFLLLSTSSVMAQQAYFIDGYHGGIYGHYPVWNTRFMADLLKRHPGWKINLEIEPVTWDDAKVKDRQAYDTFKQWFSDQSVNGRIEYVNPSYGQSYLYNISGESIIRQFSYGMKKLREHFPNAVFETYSSEEPCFTSALPQLLLSYGFKYASLKNPNTCWGGYTRAWGGELVKWQGSDGSQILTVPRYACEDLLPGSTWQTTAWNNSKSYLDAAVRMGIQHPVGMCLQDAGWKNGPWLKDATYNGLPVQYETWRHYFEKVADQRQAPVWKFSQEDIRVSLVWGAQVLQRIAQQVRTSENKLATAEKIAALAAYNKFRWPATDFDSAWKALLLAQHHDCWIVPYNGQPGDTWVDKVAAWTSFSDQKADQVISAALGALLQNKGKPDEQYISIFNPTSHDRTEWVSVQLPAGWTSDHVLVSDTLGRKTPQQQGPGNTIVFRAYAPQLSLNTYKLKRSASPVATGSANAFRQLPGGRYVLETDMYRLEIDPAKGGAISSLVAKYLGGKELVKKSDSLGFNSIRGYFYDEGKFLSSADNPATVQVLQQGAGLVKVQVNGKIGIHPFTQFITLAQGQRRIDMQVKIDWQGNPGIGAYSQKHNYKAESLKKAFYDDRYKLQVMFPLDLADQLISKDAPFDVTESTLSNTFFESWDSIKNNIILHWVDVRDGKEKAGMALFTDHTTSYVHGEGTPLGLVLQYAGKGLWGRDYDITGPTLVNYAILPHTGNWVKGNVYTESTAWNEPLLLAPGKPVANYSPLFGVKARGWEVTTILADGNDLVLRLFNYGGTDKAGKILVPGRFKDISLEELDGRRVRSLLPVAGSGVALSIPQFGVRTLRFKDAGIAR